MSQPPKPNKINTARFAPLAGDSAEQLQAKADGMLAYFRANEDFLIRMPAENFADRLAQWQAFSELLAQARGNPELLTDVRLEAQRIWGEELQYSASFIVQMCVFVQSPGAARRFAEHPEQLAKMMAEFEAGRPAALRILSTEALNALREQGFLRPGE